MWFLSALFNVEIKFLYKIKYHEKKEAKSVTS